MFKRRTNPESLETILYFEMYKYQGIAREKAIDIFVDSVENYKKATKRKKLYWIAKTFIASCLIMGIDYLTGAQCMEVFNNLCTDFGADKPTVAKEIDKVMKKERKQNEKNN